MSICTFFGGIKNKYSRTKKKQKRHIKWSQDFKKYENSKIIWRNLKLISLTVRSFRIKKWYLIINNSNNWKYNILG